MRERAMKMGGLCVIESTPGQGTDICAKIPRKEIGHEQP
jgi:signal transduction histidine kinase